LRPGVSEDDRLLPGAQLGLFQRQVEHLAAHCIGDPVPDPARPTSAVFQSGVSEAAITVMPAVTVGRETPSLSSVRFTGRCERSTSG